ncbi:type II/IV secretion system protein [Trichocoleus sp. FACHB-591]|uniref:GspE/PulE family protein n=1 Tax=Trichocoleus sp. FACHB-591 TaxID=2692872 RepID=UPI0016846ACE|nr:GspE/PulE family protein [Trichocoleus sp. FACHB-591]MBD2097701.1 type II/IV secretion system protein [Trichocoleus sp. FACHB-591]
MTISLQQQLKCRTVTLEVALQTIVHETNLALSLLDEQLCMSFFRQLRDRVTSLPVIPLLLWQNCYYLGSPVPVSPEAVNQLCYRLNTDVTIIPISAQSYREWFRQQNLINNQLDASEIINPLTGETEIEDVSEATEFSLSRTGNQIERIKTIITSALRNRASDIHLEPTESGLQVRYRIDGILRHITTLPSDYSRKVIVALKVMCDMDIADSRRPQDGRISEKYTNTQQQDQGLDLRVSTLPCVSGTKGEAGEKAVLRLLRQQNSFQTINDLGFSDSTRPLYQSWLEQPQGMIILTGPTGSGKTSTLYTSLRAIAQEAVNIITIEDPVEYILPGITQTQVNEAAGMTFAAGLRAILRQDPDIVMIGEIRDHETAETAVRTALTGHLVLTTLHTNDAIGAIPRLKDIGPDPGLISDALLGVVAQRLVRRICPHCVESYSPTEKEVTFLGLTIEETKIHGWKKGRGCCHCFGSGYLGREAIVEVLNVDDTIRQIIYEGSAIELQQYLYESDFASFRVAAIEKITQGITTVDEVKRVLPFSALCHKTSRSSLRKERLRLASVS